MSGTVVSIRRWIVPPSLLTVSTRVSLKLVRVSDSCYCCVFEGLGPQYACVRSLVWTLACSLPRLASAIIYLSIYLSIVCFSFCNAITANIDTISESLAAKSLCLFDCTFESKQIEKENCTFGMAWRGMAWRSRLPKARPMPLGDATGVEGHPVA